MHKKVLTLILLTTMSFSLIACGNKTSETTSDEEANTTEQTESQTEESDLSIYDVSILDFDYNKYITLGEYKGLEVSYIIPEVTDDQVQEEVQNIIYDHVEYLDKEEGAEAGDLLTINYVGKIDGEEFDGGSDTGYIFNLGNDEFLDEFENSLYGAVKGDTVTAKFTFPDGYGDLEGQDVVFTIDVIDIQQEIYPEYNDEFIAANSEFGSTKEYEEYIFNNLVSEAEESSKSQTGTDVIQAALANSKFKTVPEDLLSYCYESTYNAYESYAEMFGMELDDFITAFVGESDDAILADATSWAREIVLLKAIGDKENIDFDSLYATKGEEMALDYGFESLEVFEEVYGKLDIYVNVMRDAVIDKLLETAVINEITEAEYYSQYDEDDYYYEDEEGYLDEEEFDEEEFDEDGELVVVEDQE